MNEREIERAERRADLAAEHDPGTNRTGITRRKGTVTSGGAHGTEVAVDSHAARNLTGVTLADGDVVWVDLWDGKRVATLAYWDGDWTALDLSNGWSIQSDNTPMWRRVAAGVQMTGLAAKGTSRVLVDEGDLPLAARPEASRVIAAPSLGGVHTAVVTPAGEVALIDTATFNDVDTWLSLTAIYPL